MKTVDTHELSEPWAQRAWRVDFKVFAGLSTNKARRNARIRMRKIRREAALERKLAAARRTIEAAQRTIEALQSQVWRLEAQEHNRDDGNEWEKEYYLRGMHR